MCRGLQKKISNLTYSRESTNQLSPTFHSGSGAEHLNDFAYEIPNIRVTPMKVWQKPHQQRACQEAPRTHGWQPIKPALNPSRTVVQFATWKAKPRTPWCSSLPTRSLSLMQQPSTGSSFCSVSKYPLEFLFLTLNLSCHSQRNYSPVEEVQAVNKHPHKWSKHGKQPTTSTPAPTLLYKSRVNKFE